MSLRLALGLAAALALAIAACGDSGPAPVPPAAPSPLPAPTPTPTPPAPPTKTAFLAGAAQESASLAQVGFLCLGGYDLNCGRRATVEHDPLTVEGFALTGDNGESLVLVKTVNVGYFAEYKTTLGADGIYAVRQRIAKQVAALGGTLPADQIIVTSDHSHHGPDTIGIWGGVDGVYLQQMADAAVRAGVAAWQARKPARLFAASIQGPPTKSSYDNPPTNDPDPEFRLLTAETATGEHIGSWVNYSPHATVLGSDNDQATGDWTAWANQIVKQMWGGVGIGLVGALGAMDWNKSGDNPAREAEARARLRTLLTAAKAARFEVLDGTVQVKTTFLNEPVTAPALVALTNSPGVETEQLTVKVERQILPPWAAAAVIGTQITTARIGELLVTTYPGEPFPQLHYAFKDGAITGQRMSFTLGAAQDFLGYMVRTDAQYRQTAQEGTLYLAGCPDHEIGVPAGVQEGECTDHWSLMVSPNIGRHALCAHQNAAASFGFTRGPQDEDCALLTATDDRNAPEEFGR